MSRRAKQIDVSYYVDYHLLRALKGLQDDFDQAKSPAQRMRIAKTMQEVADAATFSLKVRKEP